MGNRRTSWYVAIGILSLSLLLAFLAYRIPAHPTATRPLADHWRLAIAVLLSSTWLGAAISFLVSAKVFKSGLRLAYTLFSVAIIMMSISFMQFPVFGLIGQWDSWWVNGGAALVPFMLAGALMYAGMRRFGLLLHQRGFLMSFWKVTVAAVAIAAVVGGLASMFALPELEGNDVYIAVIAWIGAYILFSFLTVRKITVGIGEDYKPAMQRLELALFVLLLACLHETTTSFAVSYGDDFVDFGLFMWPFVAAGVALVFAARAFSQVGVYNAAAIAQKAEALKDSDYLDSITNLAKLASRPEEIDPVLDEMRTITAGLKPGASLAEGHKKKLLKVYAQVEDYLVSKDPLRNFTREDLRERSSPAFQTLLVKADR